MMNICLRSPTSHTVAFLVSQDPRWNVTMPSLVAGTPQPDGIAIAGPRRRLVYGVPVTNAITSIAPNGNGTFPASFPGTPDQMFRVLAANNLPTTNRVGVSTNMSGTNGGWTFTDDFATHYPARFYRSVTP